jgi:hypothetical protein
MQRKLLRISFKVFKTCYHIFENLPKDFTCCNHMLGHVLVETCAIFCVEARLNIHSISVRCGPEDILQGPQESSRKSSYTVMRDLDSLSVPGSRNHRDDLN